MDAVSWIEGESIIHPSIPLSSTELNRLLLLLDQIIRRLNHIEEAFTVMNAAHPLSAVITLHLSPVPNEDDLKKAVYEIQQRHHLLRAGIRNVKGVRSFYELPHDQKISVNFSSRYQDWEKLVEYRLNRRIAETGPLMQLDLFAEPGRNEGIIVVSFHHAIIDGNSARVILDEILKSLAGEKIATKSQLSKNPEYVSLRPQNLTRKLSGFIKGQFKEEWQYRRQGFIRKPASHSENKILHLRFSEQFTRDLQSVCNETRLNINNLLLAALTLSILKNKYPVKKSGIARIVNFANVGLSLRPRISPEDLGCYISMLRLTILLTPEESVISLATKIKKQLVIAGRQDQIKLMAWLSKYLVRFTLLIKSTRLGISALSYIGHLNLSEVYGKYRLVDVKAFISNNQYGPEFSGFGKILHNRLGLDLNYLSAETSDREAQTIAHDLHEILSQVVDI